MSQSKHHSRYAYHLPGRRARVALIVVAAAIFGLLLLQVTNAATYVINSEAESGAVAGNATKATIAGASGGQAVTFGATLEPIAKPYRFQAITGGNSIAVVWSASASKVATYEVFRNDTKLATVAPGSGVTGQEQFGRTYIDRAVTSGTQYRYKVRAVASDGRMSDFTAVSTVTHPSSNNTTPIPNIVIDTSQGGAENADFLRNVIKPHLETWYPKLSDALAYPDFRPPNTLTIIMNPNAAAAFARIWEGEIHVRPTFLTDIRQRFDADGMFVHEATHILQPWVPTYRADGEGRWAIEGYADWARDWFTLERVHIPQPNAAFSQYSSESASMVQWAQEKYSPGLVRKVNLALIKNTYSTNYFTSLTGGRTPEQLYSEMKSQYYGATGAIRGGNNKCIDISNSDPTVGVRPQLFTCNNTNAQRWTLRYNDAGLHGTAKSIMTFTNTALIADGRCLETSGLTTGDPKIVSWSCSTRPSQKWVKGANGSLVNPASGRCLATVAGGTTDGTQLAPLPCDGSASQSWTIP